MDVRGTAALVTGAASGMGAATAALLAERGCAVIGLDLPGALERIAGATTGVAYVAGDVTSEEDVAEAVERASQIGSPLRIVVNCAGILTAGRILSRRGVHDFATFRQTIDVNLSGTFNVIRLAAEKVAATDPLDEGARGVIINTSSVAAFEGQIGQIAYAASKAGVHGMTICAARDLAQYGIRVNAIAPGVVATPMLAEMNLEFRTALEESVPFPSRLARPEEYAQLASMIIEHNYLNGETIRMDGALRMAPR